MTNHFLVTRPDYDGPTSYLYFWSKKGIAEASAHGFKVIDLPKESATRKNVESYLKSSVLIPLVVFNGHGAEDRITGHKGEPIIELNKNETILKDRIVYSIACGAAEKLGRSCVQKGTKVYIGYLNDFVFWTTPNKEASPLQDELAKLYLEHYQILISALIKGNKTGDAYFKAKKSLWDSLQASLTGGDSQVSSALWADYKNLVLIGDPDASI